MKEPWAIDVISSTGATMLRATADSGADIDVSSLPAGVYFAKVGNEVLKFIKR